MSGRMEDNELAKQIRAERKKRKKEIIARIRYNALIKASMDAADELEGPKV